MMRAKSLITFGWRSVSVVLILVDNFLFVTGNPSVTYGLLGGWFLIPLVTAGVIVTSYGLDAYKKNGERRLFLLHVGVLVVTSVALTYLSEDARQCAIAKFDSVASAFVTDPESLDLGVPYKTTALMKDIIAQPYSKRRDGFVPTFRRMDYLLETTAGKRFFLVVVMKWNGVPEISLLPYEG